MITGQYIKFLGTAGARFAVARQIRSSAGVFLRVNEKNIVLDPGPGTLVRLAKVKPRIDVTSLDAIILTHAHIDHSNDLNILIDGMRTAGPGKRGVLYAPRDCIEGENAVLLHYLRDFLEEIIILEENQRYNLADLTFTTSQRHLHPLETYGISFELNNCKISFMVDTKYFPNLVESYRKSDILVLNVVMKDFIRDSILHLSLADAKLIISELKPKLAILTHFGMTMLNANPRALAEQLTAETGVKVVAAADGMTIDLDQTKLPHG